jgi:hypothetical protein
MRISFACFVAVLVTLAACASVDDRELSEAREQWSRQVPRSYELTWQQACVCEPTWNRPIRISVAAGQITSAIYVDDDEAVAEPVRSHLVTVDGVFDKIEDAIEGDASQVDVEYDATWGYPASVFVDYNRRTADEELMLQLSDFTTIER